MECLPLNCFSILFFMLKIRHNTSSLLLYGGRLLQQYAVDNYVKMESHKFRWIRQNQLAIWAEQYQGFQDAFQAGENEADNVKFRVQIKIIMEYSLSTKKSVVLIRKYNLYPIIKDNVGRRTILPSSFVGSPCDMVQYFQDAMSLVQKFGKPDLFITTCRKPVRCTENY